MLRNHDYYVNNVFNRYNPNFIWVKNLKEFEDYIINNGLPNMVSFDHDIKPKNYEGEHENGADVANWLVNYCKQNNLKLPWCFAHSANKNGIEKINQIINNYKINENKMFMNINESKLRQIVNESIRKVLNENTDNTSMETIENIVGYSYDQDEPYRFAFDFKMMVEDVLSNEAFKKKYPGDSFYNRTDYPDCNPELIGEYIEIYRKQMNNDMMTIYNNLKEKQIEANEMLDQCVNLYTQYKQN